MSDYIEKLEKLNAQLEKEIKDRIAVEESLKKSKEAARTQFMNMPVPAFIWKEDGDDLVLIDYNNAGNDLTRGYIKHHLGTKASIFHKDDTSIIDDLKRCLREKKKFQREIHVNAEEMSSELDMIVTYVFCVPDLVMVHTHDVTESRKAEEELKRYREHLEDIVNKRTLQIEMTNMELKREMSERREAEEALRESEERNRFVAGLTSDFTFGGSVYPDGKMILKWSKGSFEDILGYPIEESPEAKMLIDAAHPEDIREVFRHIESYSREPHVFSEFRVMTRGGQERWLQVYGLSLGKDGEGGVSFISAAKDITDRKQAEVELAHKNRELRVLNDIHRIFEDSTCNVDTMGKVIDILLEESGLEKGGVYFPSEDSSSLECRVLRGIESEVIEPVRKMPLDIRMVSSIMKGKRLFIAEDEFPEADPGVLEFRKLAGVSKTLSLPIFAGNLFKVIIVICLDADVELSADMREFFDVVRIQLGIELERCDLLSAKNKYEADLRKLAGKLIESIEDERSHIALDLHDEIGQSMIVVEGEFSMLEKKLDADDPETLERVRHIRAQIHGLTDTIRQISYSLHPAMLDDLGLIPTIGWYLDNFIKNAGINVSFETAGWDGRIDPQLSLALYRVAQESLTNVVRHSGAKNISLKLTKGYPDVIMSLADDGKGFDLEGEEGRKGLGIIGMRERVNSLNGKFIIHSVPGEGTRIRVIFPLEGVKDETD
ncbi:MAG: PAS domain S-box protein [Candidatus Krumholzibacteriota bacterium]|nr:PAS domain S-box protein [Candidatus Krumholzibacteriota bacterium]